ncbi:MAG: thiamine-phosphate kinase [Chloroflexi bacterium]|nr:thiamine-phosphate kinase [Chloroflexota bacterium]MCL5026583.1 thiamine-phosphate kinase [Chloroflexota bacterium]
MQVGRFGEFRLIDQLARSLSRAGQPRSGASLTSPAPGAENDLIIGIGDDTAVWRGSPLLTIATTDAMVENVHYRPETATWYELGWKAMASNLSDVASMGGTPRYALVALALRPEVEVAQVTEMYAGMEEIAGRFGTQVVGGDIVSSPTACMVSVTVLGQSVSFDDSILLRRSGARVGDQIAVTGTLGGSGAGLAMLLEGKQFDAATTEALRRAHAQPVPRVPEGRALVERGVRAAMDVSDGLVGDLAKVCVASGVGARLHLVAVPVDPMVRSAFPDRWLDMALYGGEDYELLFTAPPEIMGRALQALEVAGLTPATVIGEIVEEPVGKVLLVDEQGRAGVAEKGGWDHFAG